MKTNAEQLNIKNRKAWHDFEILEKFVAGIQLFGTEIKALREGKASLKDAYCSFAAGELFVRMQISEYAQGSYNNHDPRRDRKLLLTRRELGKLEKNQTIKGMTIVPLRIFINERGLAKLELALARGKAAFDKREDIKSKDAAREMDRALKKYR